METNNKELLINPLIKYINDNNGLDCDQIRELYKGSDIDMSTIKNSSILKPEFIITDEEILYRLHNKEDAIEFYFKSTYDYDADIYFENLTEGDKIQKISFSFIRYGFLKYRIIGNYKIAKIAFPYVPEAPIAIEEFHYPDRLSVFKTAEIRKRKLVCHYTNREVALEKILPSNTLRFNEIKNSNDPWEYRKFILTSFENDSDPIEAKLKADEIKLKSAEAKAISFTKDSDGFRCFNNILMWSHYAENHKGVCLVFDKQKLEKLFKQQFSKKRLNPKNVQYFKSPVETTVKGSDDTIEKMKKDAKNIFYTKHTAWKYEAEYRLMILPDEKKDTLLKLMISLNKKKDKYFNEDIKALVAIFIGLEFSNTYKCVIDNFIKNSEIVYNNTNNYDKSN